MEILLTGVLLAALLFLGLLISMGNERQRRAIDELREQVEAWTEQDIKIKREKLARQITVPDALAWLESVSAAALGEAPKLISFSTWEKDNLLALIGLCHDGRRLVFTPVPRKRLLSALKARKGVLASASSTILGDKPAKTPFWELSVVSSGMFFDIEANQVWRSAFGSPLPGDRLTMYEVPGHEEQK
ncbi:MAG: hypothetical protein RBS68_05875 [Anaerolineales bacterium]|jgi:hypothetical protein|nr:hypothetical protein [Anaerolineales bacterium]